MLFCTEKCVTPFIFSMFLWMSHHWNICSHWGTEEKYLSEYCYNADWKGRDPLYHTAFDYLSVSAFHPLSLSWFCLNVVIMYCSFVSSSSSNMIVFKLTKNMWGLKGTVGINLLVLCALLLTCNWIGFSWSHSHVASRIHPWCTVSRLSEWPFI